MRTVCSLFSCIGGLDFGLEGDFDYLGRRYDENGFETVFACDISEAAEIVYNAFAESTGRRTRLYRKSIVDIVLGHDTGRLLPTYADVLIGGFPCQDFSHSGSREGFGSKKNHLGEYGEGESRGTLYSWMCRSVAIVKPKVFIAENVKGLLTIRGAIDKIRADFAEMGYYVTHQVLDASNFGVPQKRERVIILGFRDDCLTAQGRGMIEPVFDSEIPIYPVGNEKRTCMDAFVGLKEPAETDDLDQQAYSKAAFLSKGQGQSEINLYGFANTIRSEHHGNIEYRRLSEKHGGNWVKNQDKGMLERRLTIRECARLQSFPDSYKFLPLVSTAEAYKLIGNAVPPVLAWHIGRRLKDNWELLFGRQDDGQG